MVGRGARMRDIENSDTHIYAHDRISTHHSPRIFMHRESVLYKDRQMMLKKARQRGGT
jgi:hypothetical protein